VSNFGIYELAPFTCVLTFPCGCRLRVLMDEDPEAPELVIFACGPLHCPTLRTLRHCRLETMSPDGHDVTRPALSGAPAP